MVTSAGLHLPSFGYQIAPITSSTFSSGHFCCTSLGVIASAMTSKPRNIAAPRRNSSQRSLLVAMEKLPGCTKPVAWPVSFSRLV